MPSILNDVRLMMTATALGAALMTGGCGGKGAAGNTAEVQMKGLETVDGTINDAMTDLDGVQSEGTAMADTGGNAAAPAGAAKAADKSADDNGSSEADTEVVADQ